MAALWAENDLEGRDSGHGLGREDLSAVAVCSYVSLAGGARRTRVANIHVTRVVLLETATTSMFILCRPFNLYNVPQPAYVTADSTVLPSPTPL